MITAKPLYMRETKKCKIVVERRISDIHYNITNKHFLAKCYLYGTDIVPLNKYKVMHPIYSIKIEFFSNHKYDLIRSSELVDLTYNGAFFSIMNRIRNTKSIQYIYFQGESKKSCKRLKNMLVTRIRKKRILKRLEYKHGTGVYYILSGNIKEFLKFCPKYELRRIISVIRHDYYKLAGQYR